MQFSDAGLNYAYLTNKVMLLISFSSLRLFSDFSVGRITFPLNCSLTSICNEAHLIDFYSGFIYFLQFRNPVKDSSFTVGKIKYRTNWNNL